MKAVNIKWDTSNEGREETTLPKEVEIPKKMTDEKEISDWLSNEFGLCHEGFELVKTCIDCYYYDRSSGGFFAECLCHGSQINNEFKETCDKYENKEKIMD